MVEKVKPKIQDLTRELLYSHHRFSHQQIDDWFGTREHSGSLEEKLHEMALLGEFLKIADQFMQIGVPFISLKGPLLSYRLYGDATYRHYNDFDFLIPFPSMNQAVQLLQGLGFVAAIFEWPIDENRLKLLQNNANQFFLTHPEKGLNIELHWSLFKDPFIGSERLQDLIRGNKTELSFAGRRFEVFNPEFELIYLIIHGGLHGWRRLKWLLDVHLLLARVPIDEERFLQLAETMKAGRLIAVCNEMLNCYFPGGRNLPQTDKVIPYLADYSFYQIGAAREKEYYSIWGSFKFRYFTLLAFPGNTYRLNVIRHAFFSVHDLDNHHLPGNSFVYYLFGPLFKLIRVFSKEHK